jgi:AraC-like DNA-binding protein
LRREELADLAGISVDYLVRLEQGRFTNPSAQVVASLARALQLTDAERAHLYRLAGLVPPADGEISDHIPPGLQRALNRLGDAAVAVFAAEAGLSRSAFSDRFTSVVGEPAMTYVLNWRMAVARDALAAGRKSVAQVAAATGYGSVSAFSTAFSRVVGVPPMRYAQGALSTTA